MCWFSWFLDPGGWSKTATVGLYFVFPGICTLYLCLEDLSKENKRADDLVWNNPLVCFSLEMTPSPALSIPSLPVLGLRPQKLSPFRVSTSIGVVLVLAMSRQPLHLAGGQRSEATERMGRAELLSGNMSTQDPSELWGQSDGGADLLQDLGWYHGNLTRHAAEALLLSNGRDGSYLLRDSNEQAGLYSLSVRAKDSVKHFHVEYTGYSFKFGFNEYSTLKDFVKHFANQPLIGSETGTLIVLKHPYPRIVEEPSIYESVRVHTAMQTGRTENDLVPTAPSLGTKEGYLTKQGGLVK
ncbi:hypothetical protein STEG23_001819, partial [Scotinomys teguina]